MSHYNAPTEFEVKRVEHKRDLPPKDGQSAKVVLKLGLLAPDGEKLWPVEMYAPQAPEQWPQEGAKETFVVTEPKNEGWAPLAKRPRKGGGGGFRPRDPAETRAIQRQSARRDAIEYARIVAERGNGRVPSLDEVKDWMEELESWV